MCWSDNPDVKACLHHSCSYITSRVLETGSINNQTIVKEHKTTQMSKMIHGRYLLTPHSTGRRFRYADGDLGFSLKLFQIAAEA